MKNPLFQNQRPGFTLVEMLVTITIIVILAGLSLGGFKYVTTKQANAQAEIQIKLLESAIEEYKGDNGEYPKQDLGSSSTNSLYLALYRQGVQDPDNKKIYVAQLDPENNKQGWTEGNGDGVKLIDPWGSEYIYRNPGTLNPDFDLISKGQDGAESTPDDQHN